MAERKLAGQREGACRSGDACAAVHPVLHVARNTRQCLGEIDCRRGRIRDARDERDDKITLFGLHGGADRCGSHRRLRAGVASGIRQVQPCAVDRKNRDRSLSIVAQGSASNTLTALNPSGYRGVHGG